MSTQPASASSIIPETRDETHAQIAAPDLLVARTAEFRTRVNDLSGDAMTIHKDSEEYVLAQRTEDLCLITPQELLDELADEFGMSWALVARVVGVSPAAVRKWRRGETVTPTFHRQLAEFVAFSRLARERDPRIEDVGHWLEMPVDTGSDISRADLYIDHHRAALLHIAGGHITGAKVLDENDPAWRTRAATARRFNVIHHEDGSTSITSAPESN